MIYGRSYQESPICNDGNHRCNEHQICDECSFAFCADHSAHCPGCNRFWCAKHADMESGLCEGCRWQQAARVSGRKAA